MAKVKSFTIYEEYYELITLLSEKEQQELLLAIIKYMFADIEPILNDKQMKIFSNLKRPLDISKKRSKCGSAKNQIEEQKEIKTKSNENQKENKRGNTSKMLMSMSNVNVNVKDKSNRVIGEEREETNDISLLTEISKTTQDIINHLNQKTNSHFRYQSKTTQEKIKARLNEGYSLDDFIAVIDKKTKEWTGTEFEKYLCPETLFGTKFEKYLNQKENVKLQSESKKDLQWDILKGIHDGKIKIN